jgi:MPBQ/MSBQ methyltransferase
VTSAAERAFDDPGLTFFSEILHLDSLHWGLWEPGEEVSLENMRRAQQRYTERLADYVPEDVERILDVGCGIGDNARYLQGRGYQLTCVSPDVNHEKAFGRMALPNVTFVRSTFEAFSSSERFDLVLMSESNCYFSIEDGFRQCDQLLRPGGYVLAASLFAKQAGGDYPYHVMDDWLAGAKQHGYEIVRFEDVTEAAVPTLTFFHEVHENYTVPAVRMLLRAIELAPGRRMRLVRWLLRKPLRAFSQAPMQKALDTSDPERFRREGRYTFHLLKKTGAA